MYKKTIHIDVQENNIHWDQLYKKLSCKIALT